MSQENVEIVRRGFESYFATGELPWDVFDEEIEIYDHDTPDQGVYHGHAGYARWLEDWGAAWAEWAIEIDEFIDSGDSVAAFISMRTTGRGSGVQVKRRDALVYALRDGKIVRGDYYNDRQEALTALGLEQ
jgi:ketosteroid isomerase-like protein